MKKQKLYSTFALITLSTSILTACSSAKSTVPENTFAQSTQNTSGSSEAVSKKSQSKTSSSTSVSKANRTPVYPTTEQSQASTETLTESEEAVSEQAVTSSTTEDIATVYDNEIVSTDTTEAATISIQENNLTVVGVQENNYSYLAGKWRNAAGSEIVYNDKGEVISFDGVAQTNWTPSQNQTTVDNGSALIVNYDGGYTAVLPAGTEYKTDYISNAAVGEDRLLTGNAAIDFDNDQVYFRVE